MEARGIYVDIDSIYDTRFALLSVLNADLTRGVLLDSYFTRRRDSFGFIPNGLFRQFYKKRNRDLLKLARPTSIISVITEYIDTIKLASIVEKTDGGVDIYINVYPYELTEKEIVGLRLSLLPYFINCNNILIMSKPNINPAWLSKNCMMMIMYDGINWINRNTASRDLIRNQLMDTVLYLPKLSVGREDLNDADFEELKTLTVSSVKLEWLEVRDYCIR